ncbi:death on curing protein [Peptoniphilus asaccharolyticus DSM 20463]|uniref:Death on curing protein n=1 Tax=Peptoniphilus asaccharolyticus DSM 20463 TaxID=573058 RepID=A0A1W1V154_PEPAS|nr:Fic family protein [Peptoniphilus asaccharolyticus]MBL7575506.1 type II toxin-antitoxin system death-on-curing family toxin [Peptoniphilus asaccharolyticus]SMB87058.1 death on curing protein [Peptoniphilus asaccharolyticus DSM 20463]
MKYVSVDEVIKLQEKLIFRYGGSKGIREMNLLKSSIESVFQTYEGIELYPTIIDKIIQVSYSLIKNHCFIDGNKRIGVMILLYLLEINEINHIMSNLDIIKLGLEVASGEISKEAFKSFVENKIIK